MLKSLKDISLPITEEEYRADGCMHYSTLAKFERCGFHGLSTLMDRVESPSLTNGSAVDSIITGGREEFEERFMVAEVPNLPDNLLKIVKYLFAMYSEQYTSIEDIPEDILVEVWDMFDGRKNWKAKTKADEIKNKCFSYYSLMYTAENKTILSTEDYNNVIQQVVALKISPSTEWYFRDNNPSEEVERLYQLKFKTTNNGIDYSCMMDLAIADHSNKIVYPIDLKTSSHYEDEFYKSFIDWDYQIQARSYWRTLRDTMDKDLYFKDFKLDDYRFIVVNKKTLVPLVWKFTDTQKKGTLIYGKNNQYVLRDPYEIAEELNTYLTTSPRIPKGINLTSENDIITWLNK